jgi:transglutaminase-like putative cysteine protease
MGIRLDHTPENAPDFRVEEYARTYPFCYSAEELPDLAQHADNVSVGGWLAKFIARGTSKPTGQLLMTLNEAITQSFSYRRRASSGTRAPAETIERPEGTCRDFALLMMEAARSLGFAARFVTGYMNLIPPTELSATGT